MLWASLKPITLEQATMVAKRLGVSVDEIVRDREIVPEQTNPKNDGLPNPKHRQRFTKLGRINQCIHLVQGGPPSKAEAR
jgi:hypothetical protein